MLALPPVLVIPELLSERLVAVSEKVTDRRRRGRANGAEYPGSPRRRPRGRPPGNRPRRRRARRTGAALAIGTILAAALLFLPDLHGSLDARLLPDPSARTVAGPPGGTSSLSAVPSTHAGPSAAVTPPPTPSRTPTASTSPTPAVLVTCLVDNHQAPAPVIVLAHATGAASDTVRYTYDFGDGQVTGPTTASQAKHTYTEPGDYTITVTASDASGRSGVGTARISVSPGPSDPPSPAVTSDSTPLSPPPLDSPPDGASGKTSEWTLTWEPVPGATHYTVSLECQCDAPSTAWTPKDVPSTTGTSVAVSLQQAALWHWRVTAFDDTEPDGVSSDWRTIKVIPLIS
jgi:hypothetical protein